MTIDKQALREAAEKYRTTYAAHLKNPRNYDALDAWDKATSEFMALVNNDELNIIASLIDEIDMETGYREGAFVACNRWHTKFRETEAKLEAAEKRIAELREWNAGLAQESCLQQQRIAELESRTVTLNLASRRSPSYFVDGEFGNDDLAAIHNACRLECKVSVEKYLSAYGIVVKWEAE